MNLAGLVHGTQETYIRAALTCVLCAAAKETRCGNIPSERITEEQLETSIRQRHLEMARGTFQTEFKPKPVEKPVTCCCASGIRLCGSPFCRRGSSFAATRNKGQRTRMIPLAQQHGKSRLVMAQPLQMLRLFRSNTPIFAVGIVPA